MLLPTAGKTKCKVFWKRFKIKTPKKLSTKLLGKDSSSFLSSLISENLNGFLLKFGKNEAEQRGFGRLSFY